MTAEKRNLSFVIQANFPRQRVVSWNFIKEYLAGQYLGTESTWHCLWIRLGPGCYISTEPGLYRYIVECFDTFDILSFNVVCKSCATHARPSASWGQQWTWAHDREKHIDRIWSLLLVSKSTGDAWICNASKWGAEYIRHGLGTGLAALSLGIENYMQSDKAGFHNSHL